MLTSPRRRSLVPVSSGMGGRSLGLEWDRKIRSRELVTSMRTFLGVIRSGRACTCSPQAGLALTKLEGPNIIFMYTYITEA